MLFLTLPIAIILLIGLYVLYRYVPSKRSGLDAASTATPKLEKQPNHNRRPVKAISQQGIENYIQRNNQRVIADVDIEQPYPFDRSTSLVIYAEVFPNVHPGKNYPSLVFHNHKPQHSGMIADNAPCLMEHNDESIQQALQRWKDKACDQNDLNNALIAEQWIEQQGGEYFFVELEPPECAGNAYAWAWNDDQKQ